MANIIQTPGTSIDLLDHAKKAAAQISFNSIGGLQVTDHFYLSSSFSVDSQDAYTVDISLEIMPVSAPYFRFGGDPSKGKTLPSILSWPGQTKIAPFIMPFQICVMGKFGPKFVNVSVEAVLYVNGIQADSESINLNLNF